MSNTTHKNQKVYLYFKRILDIAFSIVTIIPLLVMLIVVKVCYLLSKDKSSIIYVQERIGINGKKFKLYKFRTMVLDAQEQLDELLKDLDKKKEWDKYYKFDDDPRTTKIGKILRSSSLDEFPQFINVLKGDMSIIGPRPLVEGELEAHNGNKIYESIKPGITGWWACNGRSNVTYDERLELEYYYINNYSLVLDLKIFFKTIGCIFKRTGAK